MGTKVESKTYLPGYFAMADSSVNSNGWLSYHENSKPSGHVSDSFTIITANGSPDYDKEMLKRTMLVHEATFRKQVYELHRLYKTQKDLMAQFQKEECNGYPRSADILQTRSYSSQETSGDVQRVWEVLPPASGYDVKQSSVNFAKGSEHGQNGAPLRNNNDRSAKKMLDLQLPADAYANDDDDDVEILEEKPAKILPRSNGSVLGGIFKLNLGNTEGSSHMEKSWITGLHPQYVSSVNVLNKTVEESCSMKMPDFLGAGTSSSQNHRYSSGRVNLNHLSLEDNMKEKRIGEASGSNFFGSNEEIRHNNSFSHKKDHQNVSMEWFKHEQSGVNFSSGHYLPLCNAFNQPIVAPSSSNAAVKSPWQSSNTSYTANSRYGSVDTPFAQNGFFNGFSMDSIHTPTATHHYRNQHPSKFPGEPRYRKHSPLHDVNLNDTPRDVIVMQEQGSENSPVDISWLRKDPIELMKSQVQPSCANGHSQILSGSTVYSEGSTRILGFPLNAATEKDSHCLSTIHIGTNTEPLIKREADMEMQFQNKKDDTNTRNLIDLNAVPLMDEPDIDVHQSEGGTVPQEPDDPSKDSLAITAADTLLAMYKDVFQAGSPQADTLHWFADLAIVSKDNAMVCSSESDSDDDFEALTLQLQETKGYEHCMTPATALEHKSNGDHGSVVASLLTKPRRGRARKRPQKKDFQKDILPGLASLSKHEVSDDLHTLGRPRPSKRGGRNGSQSRGRRRARSVAVTVEEVEVSPPPVPPPPAPADLDADALGITGWGRTTRRCRRPRCPPAYNASLRLA
ncbi:hypothetical protein GUJ93_ZPchr0009g1056 [Zizania palustris]|uniref:Uncharacterized protein n=1 Tax=Zizania palustris TaxID=103762 RepID=A0A8J5RLB7_ZIZPA|nr:hypothetical protein GUJ93_ZPchr0009g1056 [Zizania palustris]KAG8049072.1 hypothetical protein GUJ93_ZPchr0009g1056 [Zizania palustris]